MTSGPAPGARRRGRLFRKYVVVFVGLVGGVLMASSLVELYFAYEETKRAIVRVERARAVAAAAQIERFVASVERQVRETTRAASDDPAAAQLGRGKLPFRGGLGAAMAEQRELDFFRLIRSVPAVTELAHLDLSGKEQLRVSRLGLDAVGSQEDFSRAAKFLEAKSGKTYWSPVYLRNGVEPFLTLAVPVGQYAVEVTTAEISLKAVQQAIRQIPVGRGGHAYVVDSRGHLFAHPDLGLVRRNPDLSALPQVQGARAEGATVPGDEEAATVAEGLQGGQVLAARATIPPLGWTVVVERPLAEAYAPLRGPIVRSAAIFLLGLGLSVLASLVLARRMVTPIRALQAGAARIGAGDLAHRIEVRTGDELETLGEAFNRAAAELEESYATLERKVEARTRELADANAGLTEALEQQTATSEILRVIASSPGSVQPVLEAVVRNAARLCEASDAEVFQVDGDLLRMMAKFGPAPLFPLGEGRAINRSWVTGRAVVDRATVHVPDLSLAEADFPEGVAYARRYGHRTTLAVPLLREGAPLGAILIRRTRVQPFSDSQIALLRTFADQAVIAIENVRLFTDLGARNRDLTEALERQTATSEVLKVISRSAFDLQPVLATVVESAARLCGAQHGHIFQVDGDRLRFASGYNTSPELRSHFDRHPVLIGPGSVSGRAAAERRPVHIPDVLAEPGYEFGEAARSEGWRTVLAVPMLREGAPLGVLAIWRTRVEPFTDQQIALVETFADQAVIAVENVRLFTDLEARNRDLTESLEQQTATAEILRAISESPTDLQPVLDTVARAAARFCGAPDVAILRLDGGVLRGAAAVGHFGDVLVRELGRLDALEIPVTRGSVTGRAVVERRTVHVHDLAAAPEDEFPEGRGLQRRFGHHTMVATPLLREGTPLGAIALFRMIAEPFSDRQLELLCLFADQAVIAIENVRLFTELEARNRDLTETLEQQTATGEILRVISSSPTDVQPVFDTIARSAARLCDARCFVFRFDGTHLHYVAQHGVAPEGEEAVRRAWPRPASHGTAAGRAVLDRAVAHIPDVAADAEYVLGPLAEAAAYRGTVAVPMLRDGVPVGAISLLRAQPGPFTERQIGLLRTFADQAVIAVENVRLFTELEARNRDLTETLEQQTATSEILRVISESPTDVQPVFDTIGERARRLCAADVSVISRFDGELLRLVELHGVAPEGEDAVRRAFPMHPGAETVTGRAFRSRAVVHVADVLEDPGYDQKDAARMGNYRACLGVPMLREGQVVGVIFVARERPGLFGETQVELLKTFADQAVIAVENVRLFTELEARNRDLTETLEQQTATSEILRVISSSPTDIQPVLDAVAESAARLCDASDVAIFRVDGDLLRLAASRGPLPYFSIGEARRVGRDWVTGRAVVDRSTVHVHDLSASEVEFPEGSAHARRFGHRTTLAVPLKREDASIGAILVRRLEVRPFTAKEIELLKTFADQAVIAIENVRLFKELETRNRDLTETLEQQTATSEILRVISESPTDVQPVFDGIAASAVRLCDGVFGAVWRVEGGLIHLVAHHNFTAEGLTAFRAVYPRPPGHDTAVCQAILESRVVHQRDVTSDPDITPPSRDLSRRLGYRSAVVVPMLREGRPIGAIGIARRGAGGGSRPFSEKEISLLRTFADQAVIAIENVRLFKELEARNRDLTETLEQQTATSEILRVISSSPTDVQPVFDTIVRSAVRLCDGLFGIAVRFDGTLMHLAAHHNYPPEVLRALQAMLPMRPDGRLASARAILTRAVVHIEDAQADPEYARHVARVGGILAVPMLRDGQPVGAIAVDRAQPGPFSAAQIELLRTFADQAVIAVENVRLFQELEARNRDLTETLEQQTATGEILRAISRSLTDAQPVFDIIADRAVKLCDAEVSVVSRFDGALLQLAAFHGTREGVEAVRRVFPMEVDAETLTARAFRTRDVVHDADVFADPRYLTRDAAVAAGWRGSLAVPMRREGQVIGVIFVGRSRAGLFTDSQVELLRTFADQAIIAIENVRLFTELEARTRELTRSVGELRALGEVSQAVGSTLDLETVLATIVSRAVQLSGAYSGLVYEFDEPSQRFHVRATHQITPEHLTAIRGAPIRLGEGAIGRAGVAREPVQIADLEGERELVAPQVRDLLARQGLRSLLALPLVREDRLLGGLVIIRGERGAFSPEVVATMRTFAAQSVLAIHNARLFREIERQKQYSEALVETSPVAIATMDLDGTVVGWNPGAERLFGYTAAEALGRPMEDLVATPEARDEVRANVGRTLEGESIRGIARRTRKDGTPVDVEIASMPVAVGGTRVGMIGIYHDITELLRARREAEAANEAKGAFLATMSHEIRTPLNAVIGMSGLLLGTPLSDEQREYAEIVRQSGDALLTVINDILDFSKIEAGKLELESQPFDLRECVEGALDLVATRAAEKGLDLAYLVGDGVPAAIAGDVTRLRQVLLNLLSNAVKFTERGEVVLTVSDRPLDGAAPLHELTFSVRDTGIGIPPDRLGRLFQSFSQVDASTTRRYGGTGLGLAISQRLAELMGGRIGVTSEVGTGSEFRFTIRAAAADPPAAARRDLTGVQPSLRGKRVLVVDDNATNRRILATHLGAWGMEARATGSPVEALAWVRAGERFDLGILDMHMPDMDGAALARAIREQPAGAAVPLVLFTSLGRREAAVESAGFAAYLHKPIKPSQLFDALVSVLADQPVHVRERGVAHREIDADMARRHPLRVLLAEDNVVNQKVALRLLGQMGYQADLAANGLEAIDAVARQTYDVVLMDVQMPELDGFEASREINRRWPGERRPRLVAMTANAMQGDRELCQAAGMDDYVAKPIRVDELVAALERCRRRPEAWGRVASAASRGGEGRPAGPPAGSPVAAAAASGPGAPAGPAAPPAPAAEPHGADGPDRAAAGPPPASGPLTGDGPGAPGMLPAGPGGAPARAIDRTVVHGLAATMGREFVTELIDTFQEDARALVATLREALAAADVDAFRRAAHSLKSTSESLGATALGALARELEGRARAGRMENAGERVGELALAHEAAARELEEVRRALSA